MQRVAINLRSDSLDRSEGWSMKQHLKARCARCGWISGPVPLDLTVAMIREMSKGCRFIRALIPQY
jgi:hypothetical protein